MMLWIVLNRANFDYLTKNAARCRKKDMER